MTRFDCVVVEAQYNDLPDREQMEQLGNTIYDGLDLFLLFNVIASVRNILVEDECLKGVLQLDDAAYRRFQRFYNEEINPQLIALAREPQAGAQVSSLAKIKGKVLKFSGGIFLLVIGAQLCDLETIRDYEFDEENPNDHTALTDIIKSTAIMEGLLDSDNEGKVITEEALEYAILWAKMFHETAMGLQHCMVARTRLPTQLGHEQHDDQHDNEVMEIESVVGSDATRRLTHSKFQDPVYWAAHCIITARKFEARLVSASYMTTDSSRLGIGSSTCLTAGRQLARGKPRPTFYAGAQRLVDDNLAKFVHQSSKAKVGAEQKLWGVELTDLSQHDTSIAQLALSPYMISVEEFQEACVPMSESARAKFAYNDLSKYMKMPPPPAKDDNKPGSPATAGTGAHASAGTGATTTHSAPPCSKPYLHKRRQVLKP